MIMTTVASRPGIKILEKTATSYLIRINKKLAAQYGMVSSTSNTNINTTLKASQEDINSLPWFTRTSDLVDYLCD